MIQRLSQFLNRLSQKDTLATKWILLLGFILLVALMFPQGISIDTDDHTLGMIWTDNDLYAPFSFPIYKEDGEYQREREAAVSKVYKVFEEQPAIAIRSLDSLQKFFSILQVIVEKRKTDSLVIAAELFRFPISFTENEWRTIQRLIEADKSGKLNRRRYTFNRLRRDVLLVVNGLYLQGIVDIRKSNYSKEDLIAKRKKTVEQIVPLNKFLDKDELGKIVQQTFITGYKKDNDTVSIATKIALSFLTPNTIYQKEQTEREIQFAIEGVPKTIGAVQEGERIIGKKERITKDAKRNLESLRRAKHELSAGTNEFITFIGKILHVFAIMWLLAMYLFLFRKKIYHDNAKLLLLTLVFLCICVIAFLSVVGTFVLPLRFLIVVPVASMLLAIIFDSRVAFYGTVTLAFLVAGIRGNDYGIALASIIAGSFAVYTVRDIKKRTQIFRSIIYIFLGYCITIVALGLEHYENVETISNQLLIAFVNSVLSPIITYGLLIFLEKGFRFTTDLGLLELSDLNHPLLKELSHKTPGTFHHSVSVATLAEAGADAIGANSTLARVGAYYHDIGKVANPPMFVENQLGTENRHRAMSPKKSAKIIASHVLDGINFARENNLPDVVINFIPTHHGTMLIGTFYEKALRQKKEYAIVDEQDFRYPGPKPNSKETAIVMLADGVEASTRALEDPTVEKIEANVEEIIKSRFLDGELDDANITLRDMKKIKESFLKILIGVHHSRIRYMEEEKKEEPVREEEIQKPKMKKVKPHKIAAEKRLQKRIDSIDTP